MLTNSYPTSLNPFSAILSAISINRFSLERRKREKGVLCGRGKVRGCGRGKVMGVGCGRGMVRGCGRAR